MKPIKVLFIYGDTLRFGGIEMFMLNYFRHIDRNVVHIDFLVQGEEVSVLEEDIIQAGSKVMHLPKPGKNLLGYRRQLTQILKSGEYKIIHAHCDAMNFRIMKLAERCGVPVRIAHSHNTEHVLSSRVRYQFYEYCRKKVGKYATDCWACSDLAGKWLFGSYPYKVVPNAISLEKFRFDPEMRQSIRQQLGIGDSEIVLGHVGRFDTQKNHPFLLEMMAALNRTEEGKKYRLLMLGKGNLMKQTQEKAKKMGLEDRMIFAGQIEKPQEYYNAMDIFVLPSLFEGYPLVVTEAEANGLYCVISDCITREVNAGDMVQFCPLKPEIWRDTILAMPGKRMENPEPLLVEKGFDIVSSAKRVQEEYVRLYQQAVQEPRRQNAGKL